MKRLAIYRFAAAAITLCAAIAVADASAANARYQPTTETFPSPTATPSPNSPKINLEIGGETESEPDCDGDTGTCEVVIIIAEPFHKNVSVHWGTVDGTATAGQDYNRVVRGTLTILAGRTTATGTVTIRPDRVMTHREYFFVRIFEPSVGEIGTAQRRMVIPLP